MNGTGGDQRRLLMNIDNLLFFELLGFRLLNFVIFAYFERIITTQYQHHRICSVIGERVIQQRDFSYKKKNTTCQSNKTPPPSIRLPKGCNESAADSIQ